jgi:hypothetical protein
MSLAEAPPQNHSPKSDRRDNGQKPRIPYDILAADRLFTNKPTTEAMQEDYLDRTAHLIEKITGGEDGEPYDSVIFLDKSARPLYWIMRDLWPYVAPERKNPETGKMETIPKSEFNIKFLNIDRVPWRNEPNTPLAEAGMKPIKPEHLEGLRNIFQDSRGNDLMDGKRVLIVDEQAETGDTLTVAKTLLDKAFPTSTFDRYAWMQHPASGPVQKPAWYPMNSKLANGEEDQAGRGVFNPASHNPRRPAHGPRFAPESYPFLSTIPLRQIALESLSRKDTREYMERAARAQQLVNADPAEAKNLHDQAERMLTEKDRKSIRLRREIGQMVMDFTEGRLQPYIRTSRKRILGQPRDKYNKNAAQVRNSRPKYR